MPEVATINGASNGWTSNLVTRMTNGYDHSPVMKLEPTPKEPVFKDVASKEFQPKELTLVKEPAPVQDSSVWPLLQQWLPARKPDWDYWWKLSGPHMATMLNEAGYNVHQQYEAMLFHYHYIVPRLGARPGYDGKPKFESPLGPDGCPIEYSFKWDTATSDPDVRSCITCFGDYTGSSADPFNTKETKDFIYELSLKFPSIDLTWFHMLSSLVYDSHLPSYANNGGGPTTTMLAGFDLLKTGIMVKAYFIVPRSLHQHLSIYNDTFWYKAVKMLAPSSTAAEKLFNFLAYDPYGKKLNPAVLAIDCVHPSKSRIKFYHQTPDTSFAAVRAIMTMGGAIEGIDDQLNELYDLIKAITRLPSDYPETEQTPTASVQYDDGLHQFDNVPEVMGGYICYFDIKPGSSKPDIKIYVPTRVYGQSDDQVAKGLTTWMAARGRTKYIQNYERILKSICTHRGLDEGNGMHTFVSCAISKGELVITSYLEPEPYHPRRFRKVR